jgi:hypothetical protein
LPRCHERGALNFSTSNDLLAAFHEHKRRDCVRRRDRVRFGAVVTTLAEAMSERQQLSVPRSVLDVDDLDLDADVLASEGVIVRDGPGVAFFHEALRLRLRARPGRVAGGPPRLAAEHDLFMIESSLATVKLRTRVTKGAGSKKAALAMAYKLLDAAQERRRRFNGHELGSDVLAGATFRDGIRVTGDETTTTNQRVAA